MSVPFSRPASRATSLERMQAAVSGRPVDRPPVGLRNFLMTGRHAGFHDLGCALPVDTKIENLAVLMEEVSR